MNTTNDTASLSDRLESIREEATRAVEAAKSLEDLEAALDAATGRESAVAGARR